MKSQVGLWINFREAVIVTLTDDIEEIKRITSDVEDASVLDTDTPATTQKDRNDKRMKVYLSQYYGKLISTIHNAGSILIFGPGEAKYEFEKKLQRRGLGNHIVAIETTDGMTEAQVVAKVQQYFVN